MTGTLAWVLALVLPACGANGGADGEDPEAADEAVDATELPVQFKSTGHYNLDFSNNKQKASGTILIPWNDADTWASCGATFVSRHFAITAAHCVKTDKAPLNTVAFFVLNFNVDEFVRRVFQGDGTVWQKFLNSRGITVNGPFPNWSIAPPLTEADGWTRSEILLCGVVARCSSTFGMDNCPPALMAQDGGRGVDIALIQCPDRDPSRPFVTVRAGDETTGLAVETHWAHEMLDLSVEPNDGVGPPNNFVNYGQYDGTDANKATNWHYRGLLQNQFFPLLSRTFPNGTRYTTTPTMTAGGTERFTNLYGCHGTSGSGIFPQGSDQLLGPAVHGGSTWTDRLCTRPSLLTATTNNLSFVRPAFTRQMEALVTFDR